MLSPGCKKLLLSMTPLVVCVPISLQLFGQLNTQVLAQAQESTAKTEKATEKTTDQLSAPASEKPIDKAAQRAAARKAWLIKKEAINRAAAAKAAKEAKLKAAQAAAVPARQQTSQTPQTAAPVPAASPTAQAPAGVLTAPAEPPAKRVPMAGSQAAKEAAAAVKDAATAVKGPEGNLSPTGLEQPQNTQAAQSTGSEHAAVQPRPRPPVHYETLRQTQHEAATRSGGGDYLGAIASWTRFIQHCNIKNTKDMSHAHLERARLKRHIGDYSGAQQDLDLALQAEPRNVGGLLERAAIKKRQGDNQGALKDLDTAITIEPHKADPFVERGWLKLAMGDYVGSYGDYHAAITIDPSLKNKLAGMAQPQVSGRIDTDPTGAHEIEFSNSEFKHVEKHPAVPRVPHPALAAPNLSQTALVHLNNTAVKQINEGQFESAIQTLTYLLSSAPDYHHALENLCIAHNNWGLELAKRTPLEAASQFRLALYLDPSQGASRRNLDAMLREVGKNPKQADVRLTLCRELLASGKIEEAFVEAIESLKLKNDSGARNVMRQVLSSIDSEDSHLAETEKQPIMWQPKNHPASTTDSASSVLDQARALSASGQHVNAEELLVKLIGDIKARAAVEESGDVGNLEKALAAIAEVYQKAGDNYQAQKYRIELASLRETLNSSKDSQAPTPPAALLSSPTGN